MLPTECDDHAMKIFSKTVGYNLAVLIFDNLQTDIAVLQCSILSNLRPIRAESNPRDERWGAPC